MSDYPSEEPDKAESDDTVLERRRKSLLNPKKAKKFVEGFTGNNADEDKPDE